MRSATPALLAAAVLAAASGAHATPVEYTTGEFAVFCATQTQLCDPPATLTVDVPTGRVIVTKITYEAPTGHCSSGRLHVAADGREIAVMRYVAARESTTKRRHLALRAGSHPFEFRFEGTVGGCNAGYVASWGGQVTLRGHR